MGRFTYNYVMMDRIQFEKYERNCKRAGIQCNYNQVGTDCFGVMIRNEKDDKNELVKIKKENK